MKIKKNENMNNGFSSHFLNLIKQLHSFYKKLGFIGLTAVAFQKWESFKS